VTKTKQLHGIREASPIKESDKRRFMASVKLGRMSPGKEQMARTSAAAPPVGKTIPAPIPGALNVNGVQTQLEVAPSTLLDALRDHLDPTGTKKGCDHGQCGADGAGSVQWLRG
jgi:hypothetical protein